MFSIPKQYHVIFLIEVVLCIGAVGILSWYFDIQEQRLVVLVDERIETERTELLETAGIVDVGGASEQGDAIIADCSMRNQFEDLLGRLHTLSRADTEKASALFEACGDYFATRKSVGVMLFAENLNTLKKEVDLRNRLATDAPYAEVLETWKRIVNLESKRAELLREQVSLQRDIISELLTQGSASVINERMVRAGQVTELFAVYDKQIDALRVEESEQWSRARE